MHHKFSITTAPKKDDQIIPSQALPAQKINFKTLTFVVDIPIFLLQ